MKPDYRPDIDGLRAVAVAAVLLFHARYEAFGGGFVGVDVFFVISGFIITRIILGHEGPALAFFPRFYERRIRRLFPPLIPVLIFTTAFVYWLSPPDALREYAQSLVANIVFMSNWFFWWIGGYFDTAAETKPLLHTWSLAIEEQFYLLFPAVVLLLPRHLVTAFFAAVFALSLALNVYLEFADGAPFYNSFARFWEIALGSLLACGVVKSPERGKTALGLAGFAAILFAIFAFDKETPLFAVLPTFGAAAIILANGGLAWRLLSLKPVVGLGLISYALYLWHWPIFVFIDLIQPNPTPLHFAAGIAVAVALAVVSYFLIEGPIRKKRAFPTRRTAYALFASVGSLFIALGVTGTATGGLPQRFPIEVADYGKWLKAAVVEQRAAASVNVCWVNATVDMSRVIRRCAKPEKGKRNVLLIGDSHAAQYWAALKALRPADNVDLLAANSCSLTGSKYPACRDLEAWLRSRYRRAGYDELVISVRAIDQDSIHRLADLGERLARNSPVTILGPIQHYKPDMATLFGQMAADPDKAFDAAVSTLQFDGDGHYKARLADSPVRYISMLDALCPGGPAECRHLDDRGRPILIDNSHLSLDAATKLVSTVRPDLGFQ